MYSHNNNNSSIIYTIKYYVLTYNKYINIYKICKIYEIYKNFKEFQEIVRD